MKILYFHQHFTSPNGIVGIRSYQMARALIHKGHEVTMVCGSYSGSDTGLSEPFINGSRRGNVDEIDVVELELPYNNSDSYFKRTLTFLKFAFRSAGIVFKEEYDVLFATTTPLTAGIPGIVASIFRKKLFVFEVRDLWPELPRSMGVIKNPFILWSMSLLEWASYHAATRIIGLSPGIVEGITKRGIGEDSVKLIPNGCDLDIFHKNVTPWRPHEIKNTDLLAVFAGTHGVANGLDNVINAAVELKKRKLTGIKILLIGDGKLKPHLRTRVNNEGLHDIVIMHEPVDKNQLAQLMASADIGLQVLENIPAFYYGTSPNKFFDYIASGVPVITNYPGWIAELIEEYKCGIQIPPDDPIAFANAIEKAANNRKNLINMGKNSKLLAKKKFDRKVLAEQWVEWVTGSCQ